jgi:hypothetical protein
MPVAVLGLLKQCPECGGERLIPVATTEGANFFCRDCTLCWHVEHGGVNVVDPQTCPGCQLGTSACFERWQYPVAVAEIPSMMTRRAISVSVESGRVDDADIESELYCSAREAGIGSFAVEGG